MDPEIHKASSGGSSIWIWIQEYIRLVVKLGSSIGRWIQRYIRFVVEIAV